MATDPGQWNAYSQKEFEASPLNRVLAQAAPGEDWALGSGHEIKMGYGTNIAGEVRLFGVSLNAEYVPTLTGGSTFYAHGELYRNITRDENWTSGKNHTTEGFTDKQGRTVLRRSYNGGVAHDTHYVYDDYGNLTYVLPPKVDPLDGVSALELEDLCFQYRYDARNRLIEKKVSGKGDQNTWEQIVYNKMDRPVLTRDPNLRGASKWTFTKYDAHGRVAYTGLMSSSAPRYTLQGNADASGAPQYETRTVGPRSMTGGGEIYYTRDTYPTSNLNELHSASYYDTYLPPAGQAEITLPIRTAYGDTLTKRVQGLPTVTRTRVLGTGEWVTTVMGYDTKGRMIWIRSVNTYLETDDTVQSLLDFAGKVLGTTTVHTKVGQPAIATVDTYSYDHTGRMTRQTQKINGQPAELIAASTYDGIGQLAQKRVGGAATGNGLQGLDYSYNIRGWLKGINDPNNLGGDLFALGINYNDTQMGAVSQPLFNGNIAETLWRTVNDAPDGKTRGYSYTYDALNRIKGADYGIRTTGAFDLDSGYDMGVGGYDRNGNILGLTRQGAGGTLIDDLAYTYWDGGVANRLRSVDDAAGSEGFKDGHTGADDYYNDPNGNMKWDANKGITKITYNHLDLPTDIKITSDKGAGTGTVSYIYDAMGTKLEKNVNGTSGTEVTQYAGGYIYKKVGGATSLEFFPQPEGYVERAGTGYRYVYQYTDHLGNIRLSYTGRPEQLFSSDFGDNMDGWYDKEYDVQREVAGGRMKTTIYRAYSGTAYPLNQSTAAPGEGYTLDLTLDKGDTGSALRLYIEERDADNNHLSYNMLSTDLPSGSHHFDYTAKGGSLLILRIDKDNTNTAQTTHFFLDDVAMYKNQLTVVQEKNYYPFGLEHKGYNTEKLADHPYGYNGKELTQGLGLDTYDFGARNYEPALGRWMNVDPLAEGMRRHSPYNYAFNNPIYFIDPDGMAPAAPLNDYGIDKASGNVTLIKTTDDTTDTLYAGTGEGEDFVKDESKGSVTVNKEKNGSSILSQLSDNDKTEIQSTGEDTTREVDIDIAVTDERNKNDAFSVFKFAADNSDVEWSLGKISYGGLGTNYQVGTYHLSDLSPGVQNSSMGNVLGLVHSHPRQTTSIARAESLFGDKFVGRGFLRNYGADKPYMVYFPDNGTTTRIGLPKNSNSNGVTVKNGLRSFKF